MDKKVEKVGADGLTKKERKLMKVQSKIDSKSGLEINDKLNTQKNEGNKNNEKKIKPLQTEHIQKDITSIPKTEVSEHNEENQPNEKALRKLEWEKKLVEQKQKTELKANEKGLPKSDLKAKRRKEQELQRIAKVAAKTKTEQVQIPIKVDIEICAEKKLKGKPKLIKSFRKNTDHVGKVQLVNHLYIHNYKPSKFEGDVNLKDIHPSFIRLGVQYSAKTILGSNARCISLLASLTHLVKNLKTPPNQEFCRYLESVLQINELYLHNCRPMAVSMTNALKVFKLQLTQIDKNLEDCEKKKKLLDNIQTYINDEIETAGRAISMKVLEKISNGDIILIYGCSSLVKKILVDAFEGGKQFEVIVVDGRPLLEGREMLRRLAEAGIKCTYVLINAVSFVMPLATKILLGAHALMTNGYVMSRTGTAQVALVAQAYNKPVLVCCETYKFSEKVQTDSLVYNEIGNPESLSVIDTLEQISPLRIWKENDKLTPLHLLYDVTPPNLVTAVVTELAILPCTSVPVILRIKSTEF